MAKLTFTQLAQKVLADYKTPLSTEEIWNHAVKKKYVAELNSVGKTPKTTLGARMGQAKDIFVCTDDRPKRFYLREIKPIEIAPPVEEKKISTKVTKTYLEKDLHPLLTYYANFYLRVYCKTINHSKSERSKFGEWLHPDMVGCNFPSENWSAGTTELSQALGVMNIRLYSFELKRELNFSNLREAFFQAVSNSSWAHEGYLCVADISEDEDFLSEIKRLSGSFGIGIINLDITDPDASRVVFPAKQKENLDWESMNKLCINNDFKVFLRRIKNDLTSTEIRKEEYDKILSAEDLLAKFTPQ